MTKNFSLGTARGVWLVLSLVVVVAALRPSAQTQTFLSGSTGADGDLNLTTSGTYFFDPKSFSPPLDVEGDNIYHFKTITVATGVLVKLSSRYINGPVFWLAQGDVKIAGTVDLNGESGSASGNNAIDRVPAFGGAGGFSGGIAGDGTATYPGTAGNGPGGGAPNPGQAQGGTFTGSQFLIPLIGGSGGGGNNVNRNGCGPIQFGGGGGGGGGALLIASSTSISVTGAITANGGDPGCDGGYGSGGAVRLVAPSITGTGKLTAKGGIGCCGATSTDGRIRLEAFQHGFTGTLSGTPFSQSLPFLLLLPSTPPSSIQVKTIGGLTVNANPFTFPDVVINSSGSVPIVIEARYIPIGTAPKLYLFSESKDQVVSAPALTGSFELSTSTVNVAIPFGGSRGFVKATW